MKVLFIGTGGFGSRHAAAVRSLRPDSSCIAVRAEHNAATRDNAMSLVPDIDAGLAENPDAAVVALPPALHAAALNRVLEAGVPAYVEKPIATRSTDISAAVAEASARGIVTMTGCNLRFLPAFRLIKNMLDAEELGPVVHAALSVGQWLPDWRPGRDYRETYSARAELGGGAIFDLIHEIDLARYWFGEFDDIRAAAGNTGLLDIDCEDHADMVFTANTLSVTVHADYLDRRAHREGRIVCAEGTLRYDAIAGVARVETADGGNRVFATQTAFDNRRSAIDAMAHFIAAVEAGTPSALPLSEGLADLRLAEAARAAAGIGA
jgi:predicted dehydrogenase